MKSRSKNTPDINELILDEYYDEAIALINKELRRLPHHNWDRHWLYASMSSAYYEKRKYKIALRYAEKAFRIAPKCPYTLWNYAGALCYNKRQYEAISAYKTILSQKATVCNEGFASTSALRSDCRIRLSICYYQINELQNARKWVKLFIRYFPIGKSDRNGGVEGIEKKEFGIEWLAKLEKEIEYVG